MLKIEKAKKKVFTKVCYSIIAILVENPLAVFALTEERICDRMVSYGWLTKREVDIPKSAGTYEYKVKSTNFVPTPEGLERYHELRKFFTPSVSLAVLEKVYMGELHKEALKKKLVE